MRAQRGRRLARKEKRTRRQWPGSELRANGAEFLLTLRMNMFEGSMRVKVLTHNRTDTHSLFASLSRNGNETKALLSVIGRTESS
jgi:hypothetical protein